MREQRLACGTVDSALEEETLKPPSPLHTEFRRMLVSIICIVTQA